MYCVGILLLGMASLATSGILIDRNRLGLHSLQGIGLKSGAHGLVVDQQNILSREDLLKQKFILDILEQIQLPLQNQELLQIEVGDITNKDLYIQPLDEDMILMLNLLRQNQVLGKNIIYSLSNVQHLRQMVGLYRLLLNARDFQTLQRIIVYGRQHINTELFVNSLIMALAERSDTKMLIIPALYEILPQIYQDQDLIEEIRNIGDQYLLGNNNVGVSSTRPNLLDVITLGRQNRILNSRIPEMGGLMNILNRSQLWMPWRDLHQQLAMRKLMGSRTLSQDQVKLDKVVISQPIKSVQDKPLGLFTEDLGLKSYLNVLIDELIVKQGLRGQIEGNRLQNIDIGDDQVQNILAGRRYDTGINRNEYLSETRDRDLLQQREVVSDILPNTDRLLHVGRRLRTGVTELNQNDDLMETRDGDLIGQRRNILSGRRLDLNQNDDLIETRDRDLIDQRRNILSGRRLDLNQNDDLIETRDRDMIGQRRNVLGRRLDLNQNDDLIETRDRDMIGQRRDILSGRGLHEDTDVIETRDSNIMGLRRDDIVRESNNDRVLYVGRRLKNRNPIGSSESRMDSMQDQHNILSGQSRLNSVSLNDNRLLFTARRRKNLSGIPITNDNVMEDYSISGGRRISKDEQRNRKSDKDERREKYIDDDSLSRRRLSNDDDDDVMLRKLSYGGQDRQDMLGMNRPMKNGYDVNDEIDRGLYYRNRYGQGGSQRNSVMGRGRDDLLNTINRDHVNIGDELPTTSINDERLVHINRRRLNEIDEGRRVGNEEEGDRKYVDRDGDSMRGGRIGMRQAEGDRKYVDRDGDSMRGGRIGMRQEEGDRRYVDRDDDSMRGGRIGMRQEEGDRKYVDRDDDSMRGGNIHNRFIGRDGDKQDRLTQRKESDNFQRYRRSLDNMNYGQEQSLNGKLLLHNLQQLVARINIERISLGQTMEIDNYLQVQGNDRLLMNDLNHQLGINRGSENLLMLQKINDISQRLDMVLRQQISRISGLSREQQINEIGLILARQIIDLGLLDIFQQVLNLDHLHQEGHLSNILDNPLNQLLLCHIMKIVDLYVADLHQDEDILLKGVNINNIKLDKLQTYLEYADVDLTNLLESPLIQKDSQNMKLVVGRIPRLNHKSFNIQLDVSSDRQQRVVIRTFLGPKIDSLGNIQSIKEQRQNYILLDINSVDLMKGRNTLQLKSNDITWTTRDTTSCSEIYQRVMRALDGDVVLNKDLIIGQSNLLPHRLLIPRGRINGLPMQLLTVITPLDEGSSMLGRSLIGMDSLLLDRLPLNYPLDGDIQDLNGLLSIPNVYLKDVMIYHEDHIKLPLLI